MTFSHGSFRKWMLHIFLLLFPIHSESSPHNQPRCQKLSTFNCQYIKICLCKDRRMQSCCLVVVCFHSREYSDIQERLAHCGKWPGPARHLFRYSQWAENCSYISQWLRKWYNVMTGEKSMKFKFQCLQKKLYWNTATIVRPLDANSSSTGLPNTSGDNPECLLP